MEVRQGVGTVTQAAVITADGSRSSLLIRPTEGDFMRASFLVFFLLISFAFAQQPQGASSSSAEQIALHFDTSEAEAVLGIVDKHSSGAAASDSDWQRLLATEP